MPSCRCGLRPRMRAVPSDGSRAEPAPTGGMHLQPARWDNPGAPRGPRPSSRPTGQPGQFRATLSSIMQLTEQTEEIPARPTMDLDAWLREVGAGRPEPEAALLARAGQRALLAHEGQKRASGEPYVGHSLEVARIVSGLGLDAESVMAAVLHDTVEDTGTRLEDLSEEFGPGVARLVDGVTKMGRIGEYASGTRDNPQAENLRKLLLAMAEDVRVVLIKLADRLHNMRTLKHLDAARQYKIARETMEIYAPLANRLGIWQLKWELEDLALRYLEPETYRDIAGLLDARRVDRERQIQQVIERLASEFAKAGIHAEVTGRPKHIYSIWRKMKRKNVDFHEIFDVQAVRVLVDQTRECYAALGIVHSLWHHIPREFDDYIANPKENNYRSLHTAVLGPDGRPIEVQIRTHEMHQHSELGIAAHWRYKEGRAFDPGFEQKVAWLRQLLEWKDEESTASDFVDRFKNESSEERVYVLTPQGKVVSLGQGATALDFAYHIHTDIGHRCRGVKVNGRIVPLNQELHSGDQVEVLTTRHGSPSRDWLNPHLGYLRTSRARAKVRHWFKTQDREKNIHAGRASLERELRRIGTLNISHEKLAQQLQFSNTEDMLAALGSGDLNSSQLAAAATALLEPTEAPELQLPCGRRAGVVAAVGMYASRESVTCSPRRRAAASRFPMIPSWATLPADGVSPSIARTVPMSCACVARMPPA
jgi:GTP pyrophosphokinase